ncbi:MAG TPA: hypothetical protein VNK48_10055 [Xanthobacteraceae bacterium]|nr:hypothetical protein [Xanthobacteraceae bacterium]
MMKTTSKFLLAGAFAALVVAISAAPSEAGRAKRTAAATPACQPLTYCATNCANGWCTVYQCGFDGKYYQSILPPVCAQGLCVNVQKKC